MKKIVPVVLALLLIGGVAHRSKAQADARAAYVRLMGADLFAFGGVGFAGVTTPGDSAYRVLMRRPAETVLPELEAIYAQGTPAAKAYALTGFHRLNRKRFDELRTKLPALSLTTAHGCILDDVTLADAANEIATGVFDDRD